MSKFRLGMILILLSVFVAFDHAMFDGCISLVSEICLLVGELGVLIAIWGIFAVVNYE